MTEGDKCLICYQLTDSQPFGQEFRPKDVLKIDKISSAFCSILNLPNYPYEELIKSSIICSSCIGLMKVVEKILSDLDFIQKRVIETRSQLEANLINSATKSQDAQELDAVGEGEGSLTSRNRTKIVEKIKSWDKLDTLEEHASDKNDYNFDNLMDFADIGGVEAILNVDSIKKEQENYDDLNEWEPPPSTDIGDLFINPTSSDPTQNRNESLIKPSHVVLAQLDLPLEYLNTTFDINEDYIQSYIRQDSKIILQAQAIRYQKLNPIFEHYQEDNSDDYDNFSSSDDEFGCSKCNYSAKSERGLKLHMARIHKKGKGKRGRPPKNNLRKFQKNESGDQNVFNDESSNLIKQSRVKEVNDQEEIINCEECQDYSTYNLVDFHLHQLKEHSYLLKDYDFVCPICHKNILRKQKYEDHLKLHHTKRPFVCYCGLSFKLSRYLTDHQLSQGHANKENTKSQERIIEYKEKKNNSVTEKGNNVLRLKKEYQKLGEESGSLSTLSDNENRKKFYSNLYKHAEVIEDENLEFICTENCGFKEANFLEYYSHILNIHGIKFGFQCPIVDCGTSIKMPQKFKLHLQIHKTKNKPYVCCVEGCDAEFVVIDYLQDHIIRRHGMTRSGLRNKNNTDDAGIKEKEKSFPMAATRKRKYDETNLTSKNKYQKLEEESALSIHSDNENRNAFYSSLCKHSEIIEDESLEFTCTENCGFKEANFLEYYYHILNFHGIKVGFKCPVCGTSIKMPQKFKRHLQIHKIKNKPYACCIDGCDATFAIIDYFRDHMARAHHMTRPGRRKINNTVEGINEEKEKYNRVTTGRTYSNILKLKKKYQKLGKGPTASLSILADNENRKAYYSNLYKHAEVIEDENLEFVCTENCGFRETNLLSYYYHILNIHKIKRGFKCPILKCGINIKMGQKFKQHLQIHKTKNKPYECSVEGCDYKFAVIRYLREHMIRGHGMPRQEPKIKKNITRSMAEKIYCEVCGKVFYTQSKYETHFEIHNESRSHFCEICGKSFSTQKYLTSHQRYHGIGKPLFTCEYENCKYTCLNSVGLNTHVDVVHLGKRDYICELCSKAFARKQKLMDHIRCKHSESHDHVEKPKPEYQCNICLIKKFYTQAGLSIHKRSCLGPGSHTKSTKIKRKFRCPENNCTEEYTRNNHLKRHIAKTHTKILTVQCHLCDKRFFVQNDLKRHLMAKHDYEKPFKCEECGKSFSIMHYLKRHKLQNHADDSEKLFKCLPCGKHYGTKESLYFHNKFHHPELLNQGVTQNINMSEFEETPK